jgi:hypothetical protein
MIAYVCPTCGRREAQAGHCRDDGARLEDTRDPLLGETLGRWRLARVIGEGGMGRVYLGVQPEIGGRVAIKVLSEACARNRELVERFFAEARAVNLIRHESIVGVLDLAVLDDGRPYIVMEYLAGPTLAALVKRGPLPLGTLAALAGEVLSALSAAHGAGVVHRDLKPDNVLVTHGGRAKVLDFGVAKLSPQAGLGDSPRTATGAVLGTPDYMAPEQVTGQAVDGRADQYAMGALLYECATGRRPFAGATLFELMLAQVQRMPDPPSTFRLDLPPAFEAVIVRAMAKAPADRFASAEEMATALADATVGLPAEAWAPVAGEPGSAGVRSPVATPSSRSGAPRPPSGRSPAPKTAPPGRRRAVIAAAVAVGLGAAIGVGVATLGGGGGGGRDGVGVAGGAPDAANAVASAPPLDAANAIAIEPPLDAAVEGVVLGGSPDAAVVVAVAAPPPGPVAAPPPVATPPPARDAGVIDAPPVAPAPPAPPDAAPTAVALRPGARISQPRDYDPRRFDALAYLAKAQSLARQLAPDAALTQFDVDGVGADGRADLTLSSDFDATYEFRSPAASRRPDVPRGVEVEIPCMVYVVADRARVEAYVVTRDACREPLRPRPRCTLAQVWARALSGRAPAGSVAQLDYLWDGWFVQFEDVSESVPDDC